jgi:hypothetical protein
VFLYPALLAGFFFVAVPLLVHLINMLRHRRQPWAAMDFLLASYRKQKKWIRLRQLLLLLSRLAVAALLIAMLCGWTGGGQLLGMLGGQTSHHVVILDDSYSMGDNSGGADAYKRSLQALQDLTQRLATDDGNHQLTVMRSSRAAMAVRGGSESGDAAADLSAQTITSDARLINRVMSTSASPVRTDLIPALDLAVELIASTPADSKFLYIASDFRQRDWGSPERVAESLRKLPADEVEVRMIDCATDPQANLGITELVPVDDVWVAGVPVVVKVTVHNYGTEPATNVSLANRVIRYPAEVQSADPTLPFSGKVDSLPPLLIDTLAPGKEITKTFQVYVTDVGTHAIEVSLPDDALAIDNTRACVLPLSAAGKVLIIDNDPDAMGAYHVASVLNPGSQVRIGAVPDIQPPSFLRSATIETLAPYRAIYLIDLPDIGENAADALAKFVRGGGGLAWFLGSEVRAESYNRTLLARDRRLLPAPLTTVSDLPRGGDSGDIGFGQPDTFLDPLRGAGDAIWGLVGLAQSWMLAELESTPPEQTEAEAETARVRVVLKRRDGQPLVTQQQVGKGRIVTVLTGLNDRWTNWRGDPTFVPFLLLTNASLWSGAAPSTQHFVDDPLIRELSSDSYIPDASYVPASPEPPRVPIDVTATESAADPDANDFAVTPSPEVRLDPLEMAIAGEANVDEILRPGIAEWVLTRNDGRGQVVPVASVIRVGEGDLRRAAAAEIQQGLLPLEVKFVSSSVWSQENRAAGSSTLTLLLLGLLGIVLAGEQALAYWASYHVAASARKA